MRVALGRPPAVGRRVVEQGGGVECGGVGARGEHVGVSAALDLERVGVRVALGLERDGRRCRVVRVALGRPPAVGRRVVDQGGGVACGGVGACEIPQPSPPLGLPVAPHGAKRVIRAAEVAVRQAVRKLELRQTVRPKLLHAQRRRCARRRRAPRASEGPRRA